MADAILTLGPLLFNWPADRWRDFYAQIADEAPIDRVAIGEVVCSKRLPFVQDSLAQMIERLERGGKEVVLSSLALPTLDREMRYCADLASSGRMVEINDLALIGLLGGRPFHVGPLVNVYNEATVEYLARRGARAIALPPELPEPSIAAVSPRVAIEVWAFGRVPLAISARCYHARVHNLAKDSCQFVCERDPDGLAVETLDGEPFLAVNGVQTLSHTCCNFIRDVVHLSAQGVASFRLSPHACDMVGVARSFRAALLGELTPSEAVRRFGELGIQAPFSNGFVRGAPGATWNVGPGK